MGEGERLGEREAGGDIANEMKKQKKKKKKSKKAKEWKVKKKRRRALLVLTRFGPF